MKEELLEEVQACKDNGFTVFVCGNGGSAATAEHFTNDLFSKGVRAICLNSNTSIMTMIANDFGYEQVYSRQLKTYASLGDLLVVFSVSGKSKNILNAMDVLPHVKVFGFEGETFAQAEDRHLQIAHWVASQII